LILFLKTTSRSFFLGTVFEINRIAIELSVLRLHGFYVASEAGGPLVYTRCTTQSSRSGQLINNGYNGIDGNGDSFLAALATHHDNQTEEWRGQQAESLDAVLL